MKKIKLLNNKIKYLNKNSFKEKIKLQIQVVSYFQKFKNESNIKRLSKHFMMNFKY